MSNNSLLNEIAELVDKANKYDEITKYLGTSSNTTLDKVKSLKDKRVKELGFDPKKVKEDIQRVKQEMEDKFYDFSNWAANASSYISDAMSECQAIEDEYLDEELFDDIVESLDVV